MNTAIYLLLLESDPILSGRDGDITTSVGDIFVTDVGVTFRLNGGLSRFSGCYPWEYVPKGLAALRVLAECEPEHAFDSMVSRLELFGCGDRELDEILGRDEVNASRIMSSCPMLAERCPRASIGREIEIVSQMAPSQLGSYIDSWFR